MHGGKTNKMKYIQRKQKKIQNKQNKKTVKISALSIRTDESCEHGMNTDKNRKKVESSVDRFGSTVLRQFCRDERTHQNQTHKTERVMQKHQRVPVQQRNTNMCTAHSGSIWMAGLSLSRLNKFTDFSVNFVGTAITAFVTSMNLSYVEPG